MRHFLLGARRGKKRKNPKGNRKEKIDTTLIATSSPVSAASSASRRPLHLSFGETLGLAYTAICPAPGGYARDRATDTTSPSSPTLHILLFFAVGRRRAWGVVFG